MSGLLLPGERYGRLLVRRWTAAIGADDLKLRFEVVVTDTGTPDTAEPRPREYALACNLRRDGAPFEVLQRQAAIILRVWVEDQEHRLTTGHEADTCVENGRPCGSRPVWTL